MGETDQIFTGVLESIRGKVISNSGGVLKIEFEYNNDNNMLPFQLDQGMNDIAQFAESLGTEKYFIKPGDNLWEIAQANNTTIDALVRANNIDPEQYIYPGHYLKIPGPIFDTTFRSRVQAETKTGLVGDYEKELSQGMDRPIIQASMSDDVNNEFTKNAVTGGIDAVLGEQIAKMKPYQTQKIRLSLGPEIEGIAASQVKSVKTLQGISKFAGPAAALSYGYDMYKDYKEYEGADRAKAMLITTGGTAVTIVSGGWVADKLDASLIAIIGTGLILGTYVGLGVNHLKEELLNK